MKFTALQDIGLLVGRLFAGGMMLTHGIPKISRFFAEGPVKFADPFGLGPEISLGMAVFAEVICAILVMLGFKTKLATITLMITMLVAAFYAHWDDPFGDKELSLLYFAIYLVLFVTGGGKISLDRIKSK